MSDESISYSDFLLGCREDPSWFVQWVLELENGVLHGHLQEFLTGTADGYVEIPRGHAKTTQLAGRYAWEIGRDPDIRIKNVGSSDDESKKTVSMVKRILESDRFREVFPEVVPDAQNWGTESLTVRRGRMVRDPTLEAVSIFGRAGGRADLLCFDDVCDLRNSIQQPTLREQVKEFYSSLWLPTLDVSRAGHRVWRFATPWHVDDLTARWRERHGGDGTLFRRPCVETASGDVSPWGEVFTESVLASRRRELGPVAYSRAYLLRPVSSEEIVFPAEWLDRSMYRVSSLTRSVLDGGIRVGAVDFAFSKREMGKSNPDWSVFLVGVRDLTGTVWVERLWRMRSTFPEFAKVVSRNVRELGVRQLIAESQGPQAGLVQQLRTQVGCPVVDALRSSDKFSRACEKQSFVEEGRLRLPRGEDGSVLHELRPLYDEVTTFPASDHDDLTDAMVDLITLANRCGYGASSGGYGGGIGNVLSGRDRLWRFGYR